MPTVPFNKYDVFREDLYNKVHKLFGTAGAGADILKVLLSNTAPNAAFHKVRADVAEIGAGTGAYPVGGLSLANVGTRSGGTFSLVATDVTFQPTGGGSFPPFRYAIVFNDTWPSDPLVGWYDYGTSIPALTDPETFVVDFGATLFTDT
jgi:hypothetical protein